MIECKMVMNIYNLVNIKHFYYKSVNNIKYLYRGGLYNERLFRN